MMRFLSGDFLSPGCLGGFHVAQDVGHWMSDGC